MNRPNITTSTYGLMLQLLLRAKHRIHELAENHGISAMQAHALAILSGGAMTMSALGQRLHCDASNVTGIVDRLEEHQLIERQADPHDRRVKCVLLSRKGQTVQQQLAVEIAAAESAQLGPVLTAEEIETLNRILSKLIDRANQLDR
jgi:DNA-binding MarR family transcriptional regulator